MERPLASIAEARQVIEVDRDGIEFERPEGVDDTSIERMNSLAAVLGRAASIAVINLVSMRRC
jgi:hypothetical protein